MHYAHSLPEQPEEKWQVLEDHLRQTAELAEVFAGPVSPGWGRILGLWHDAGKYQRAFQERIRQDADAHVSEKVDHSTVGALIAKMRGGAMAAFAVAGHHGGLPNAGTLVTRLKEKASLLNVARRDGLPGWIEEQAVPEPPGWIVDQASISLWTRFLFSALVDADFLDTERFYAGGMERDLGVKPSLAELKDRLDKHIAAKAAGAKPSLMNDMRSRGLAAARLAVTESP